MPRSVRVTGLPWVVTGEVIVFADAPIITVYLSLSLCGSGDHRFLSLFHRSFARLLSIILSPIPFLRNQVVFGRVIDVVFGE